VDFRNTIIIMTSNIGSPDILARAGDSDWSAVEASVERQVKEHFRPEFLNRIDDTIVFRPLGHEELLRIVELQLQRVAKLALERDVHLEVSDEAKVFIAREGYEPAFGARPLKRAVQRLVQDPLALKLLEQPVPEAATVRVELAADEPKLLFTWSAQEAAA
jgi:ATP-dependent Clp protease ATP-binding subunit ClpB